MRIYKIMVDNVSLDVSYLTYTEAVVAKIKLMLEGNKIIKIIKEE